MIGVIDLKIANLRSVSLALSRLGEPFRLVEGPAELSGCDILLLPGVGHLSTASQRLGEQGLREPLRAKAKKTPTLGICLGMQLFFDASEEGGEGLGLIPGQVVKLQAPGLPLPHLGWNEVTFKDPAYAPLDGYYSFIHTYAPSPEDPSAVLGTCDYGKQVVAAVKKGPLVGVQFHPEKSGPLGTRFLSTFLEEARAWTSSQASIS